jgi:hypothetical protein
MQIDCDSFVFSDSDRERNNWSLIEQDFRSSLQPIEKLSETDSYVEFRVGKKTAVYFFEDNNEVLERLDNEDLEVHHFVGIVTAGEGRGMITLRATARIHHAALSAAERHGGARYQDVEGTMYPPTPVRDAAARVSGHRRLDQVLQRPTATPGVGNENAREGLRISGVTCAESAGSLQLRAGQPVLTRKERSWTRQSSSHRVRPRTTAARATLFRESLAESAAADDDSRQLFFYPTSRGDNHSRGDN